MKFASIRDMLLNRRSAYRRLFLTKEGKLSKDGEAVLAHLRKFAKHGRLPIVVSPLTGQSDSLATGARMGRQEVVNLIIEALYLDDKTVINTTEEHENA